MTALMFTNLVDRYVAAWNEHDASQRRSELLALYTADATLLTNSEAYVGVEAVVAHIGDVFDQYVDSGRYRFATGGAVEHHAGALFRWEMRGAKTGELADAGMNFFRLSADGRIATDHQFNLGVESSIGTNHLARS